MVAKSLSWANCLMAKNVHWSSMWLASEAWRTITTKNWFNSMSSTEGRVLRFLPSPPTSFWIRNLVMTLRSKNGPPQNTMSNSPCSPRLMLMDHRLTQSISSCAETVRFLTKRKTRPRWSLGAYLNSSSTQRVRSCRSMCQLRILCRLSLESKLS